MPMPPGTGRNPTPAGWRRFNPVICGKPECSKSPEGEESALSGSRWLPDSAYYRGAVLWALENNVTTGVTPTQFQPNAACTRGQVVTFLWRANGKPAASGSSSLAASNPGKYYTDAVAWAGAGGLLSGTGSTFNPAAQSPRADIVTYLYRDAVS